MWFTIGDSQYMIHNMWFTIKLCILGIKTIFWNLGRKWQGDFGLGEMAGGILAEGKRYSLEQSKEYIFWSNMFLAIHWSNPKNTYFGPICFGTICFGTICFGLNMFWGQYVFVKYVFANMFLANMFWVICFSTAPNSFLYLR